MKSLLLLIACFVLPIVVFSQDKRLFIEGTISAAWNSTDVKNESKLGLGFGFGYSFNYEYGRRFGFDIKFRYHKACWHGQDYETTDLNHLGNNYTGPLVDYKNELGYTINNFANDAREYGIEFAVHLNRLREERGIDPYIFGGLSLVKNQAKGDLIHYVGLVTIYNYDNFDLNKENHKYVLDGTYESLLEGSQYGSRIQLMPGIGVGCIYHFNKVVAIGLEHKTIFTFTDDFDGFVPNGARGEKSNMDIFHYTGVVLRMQMDFKLR
ncbi:MAG: hypothetical protein HRT58_15435 [Crocinitomicaceae bacterium]|nr:hypothetical protein [Flavobacteriales bacterium]NQZ37061.1 hypothetical protein [Crocinitomicaceae bacterium]